MKTSENKRCVLLRLTGLEARQVDVKKLRVDVTLQGLSAAVVEELARASGRAKADIVRTWIDETIRRRTLYDAWE